MNHLSKTLRFCSAIAIAGMISLSVVTPVVAQQTTASISGIVFEADGSTPKANASVNIVHVDSGARWTTTTTESGNYRVNGLRPGGPYEVYVEGSDLREEDVYVNISAPAQINLGMVSDSGMLEEVIVTGERAVAGVRMGASTVITSEEINEVASINRDFKNVIRLDPRVGLDPSNQNAITIGGFNNRVNSLTVDGVRQNDEFGLNQSGYPTQRSPVSMDAVEQISVESAPFGVEYGGFMGGTINVVTKSGGNDFHGGAYYYFSNDSLVGDESKGRTFDTGEFDEEFLGATLSGPILKDRLWFFVSYENYEASDPAATLWGPEDSNRPIQVEGVTQADITQIRAISNDVYGYDPLGLLQSAVPVEDEKLLVKLDWQINENHNANFTYQDVSGNSLVAAGSSTGSQRLAMASQYYNRGEEMVAYSGQLFSRWTSAFSTEIKYANKEVHNFQQPLGGEEFAQMEIELDTGASVILGPDYYRHANFLDTENQQFKLKGDYVIGNHLITAGYEWDEVYAYNIFAPGSLGDYNFDSIEEFQMRRADSLFMENISATGDVLDLGAGFTQVVNSFYLQDVWDVTDTLILQFGVRHDSYSSDDAPFSNPNFYDRNGFTNTHTMDGRSVTMPRFGFNWQATDTTTIRGGIGLFSGGVPIGFMSNSFSAVGILNMDGAFFRDDMENIEVDGYNIDQSILDQLEAGDGNVVAVDPDYDIPSTWKINLAWDQQFDIGKSTGYRLTADLILAYVKNAPLWVDTRRQVIGQAADGRPIYGQPGCETDDPYTSSCRAIDNYDIIMTNTDEGTNHSFALSLGKYFDWGRGGELDSYISWTYQDIEAVSDAMSSTPTSLLGREQTYDRNHTLLGQSTFETTNRIVFSSTWRKEFFADLMTSVNVFYSYQSGKPYGYTYDGPSRGYQLTFGGNEPIDDDDSQLLYVPTGPDDPKVMYGSGFDLDGFEDLINRKSCLGKFRGQIALKNACNSPSYARLDMRFTQQLWRPFKSKMSKSVLEFTMDIENLTNWFSQKWGHYEQIGFPFVAQVVTLNKDLGPNGELIYDRFRNETPSTNAQASLWKVQFGLRYRF